MEKIKILCAPDNLELGRKIIDKLAIDNIEAEVVVEEVDKAYLGAQAELDASHSLHTSMAYLFELNKWLIGQYQYQSNMQQALTARLQKDPKARLDIRFQNDMKKVANDLEILEPAMYKIGAIVAKHVEEAYGEGKKFQMIKTEVTER